MTATYSTNQDLYLVFGQSNIKKWADVDNDRVYGNIEARLDWARAQAYDEINSKLAESLYQFPLKGPDYPLIIVRMEASLAGVLLYESRGVTDVDAQGRAQHALQWHRTFVERCIRDIFARRLVLQGATLRDDATDPTLQNVTAQFVPLSDPSLDRNAGLPVMEDDLIEIRVQ